MQKSQLWARSAAAAGLSVSAQAAAVAAVGCLPPCQRFEIQESLCHYAPVLGRLIYESTFVNSDARKCLCVDPMLHHNRECAAVISIIRSVARVI